MNCVGLLNSQLSFLWQQTFSGNSAGQAAGVGLFLSFGLGGSDGWMSASKGGGDRGLVLIIFSTSFCVSKVSDIVSTHSTALRLSDKLATSSEQKDIFGKNCAMVLISSTSWHSDHSISRSASFCALLLTIVCSIWEGGG